MQALAIYGRPVTATAVDYLLQPFLTGINSAPVLSRLVNMHLARKEAGRYYLHPVDREYALSRVPHGEAGDREVLDDKTPFTQIALADRGANYFADTRLPRENWKSLADLAPQLAEIDLRCAAENYSIAAKVLEEISLDYLHLWGHFRLMITLHENFQDKLDDPVLRKNLGVGYCSIGQVRRAISCHEQALAKSREQKNRRNESACLGNLGNCYFVFGQIARAVEYHEQSLAIDREIGNRRREGGTLGNLGNCYYALGQTSRAIEYYEQALAIAREIVDRRGEGIQLGNLGTCYSALGQTARAIEYYEQALAIALEIGDRASEGRHTGNLAEVLINEGRYAVAIQNAQKSLNIAEEVNSPTLGNVVNGYLAFAHFYTGNLPAARIAAEAARQYDEPLNNHYVLTLLGAIALRQEDHPVAQEAFVAAVQQAEQLLAHSAQNYSALDSKGLALSGLALCEGPQHVAAAIAAYLGARAINKDAGIVKRVLRLFDELAKADSSGVLAEVRAAAAGDSVSFQ